jgi:ATP-binding cassette subfamily B protein
VLVLKHKLSALLNNVKAQLVYLPQALRLVWDSSRRWTLAWAVLLVVQGLLPAATVYLTKILVDNLVVALSSGDPWAYANLVLWPAVLMGVTLLLTQVLQSVISWVSTAQSQYFQDHLSALIHQKSVAVDFAFYESPAFFDRLEQVRNEARSRPLALLNNIGSLVQNSITLVAMGAMLLPYGIWVPFALLLSTLPAFYILLRFNQRYHRWWQQTTTARRWAQYYDIMLTHSSAAAEVRLFNLGPHFQDGYQSLRQTLRTDQLKLVKEMVFARFGAGGLAILVAGAALLWMVWRAFQGFVTLGDLTLFYQAFNRGQGLFRTLLTQLGEIYSNSLFLGNLFEFFAMEPEIRDAPEPVSLPLQLQTGLEIKDVTFYYPDTEHPALQNFSLSLPAGKVTAIVGANGAGKSTLLKLMCRFYDPQTGSIELDGVDLRQFSVDDLRRHITVLFQDPVKFHATAGENIALGDLSAKADDERIKIAARGAGATEFIERLQQGLDSQLGKWFANGVDLSGGEWQRLALARAFYRQAPIMILDEPTSALDSWSEIDWYDRFEALAKNRTSVIITHRFTTAMRADIIHVMDNGQIVESGSHADLLSRGGPYAESWQAQMDTAKQMEDVVASGNGHLPAAIAQNWSQPEPAVSQTVLPRDSDFSVLP